MSTAAVASSGRDETWRAVSSLLSSFSLFTRPAAVQQLCDYQHTAKGTVVGPSSSTSASNVDCEMAGGSKLQPGQRSGEGQGQGERDVDGQEEMGQPRRRSLPAYTAVGVVMEEGLSDSGSSTPLLGVPTLGAVSYNTPSTPTINRRRSSLADGDSPHAPSLPSFPISSNLAAPQTDASIHLQQARASVAGAMQPESSGVRRRSSVIGDGSSSLAQAAKRFAVTPTAPSRLSQPPISPTKPGNGLLYISQNDLRRPSFLDIGAETSSTSSSTPAPLSRPWRSFLVSPSRRIQKTLRMWLFAAVSLYAFVKFIDVLGFSANTYRHAMTELQSSVKLAGVGALDQLPLGLSWVGMRGKGGKLATPVAPAPFGTGTPGGGAGENGYRTKLTEEEEERAKTELVLSPAELESVRRNRRGMLWAAPTQDIWVHEGRPMKGHVHESTVIFLTGLGEQAADAFLPVYLHKRFPDVRWVLPQSPNRTVTVLGGESPAWFNIRDFPYDPYTDRDYASLFSSVRSLNAIIASERALLIRNVRRRLEGGEEEKSAGPRPGEGYAVSVGLEGSDGNDAEFGTPEEQEWASRRIVLSGFSQGGVVSLLTALTHPLQLAGLVVFSTFLPLREDLAKLAVDLDRKDLPVFWGHGVADPYLLFNDALASISLLQPAAVPTYPNNPSAIPDSLYLEQPSFRLNLTDVTFKAYVGLEHTFTHSEIGHVGTFLEGVFAKAEEQPREAAGGAGASVVAGEAAQIGGEEERSEARAAEIQPNDEVLARRKMRRRR